MKGLSGSILILFCLILVSCNKERANSYKGLPFYNTIEMTPEWIEPSSPKFDSIHVVDDFKFLNQDGNVVASTTVDGKIYVANFFFSICPGICPKMMKNISKLQEEYLDDEDVLILSHSVTPWIDSVQRLNEYAEINNIDSKTWHLLTGYKTEIYALARQSYFADEGFGKSVTNIDDFLHTENIILVDRKRRIRGVYSGTLPLEMKRIIEDIETLKKED